MKTVTIQNNGMKLTVSFEDEEDMPTYPDLLLEFQAMLKALGYNFKGDLIIEEEI